MKVEWVSTKDVSSIKEESASSGENIADVRNSIKDTFLLIKKTGQIKYAEAKGETWIGELYHYGF